ncbi:aromatic ring-hydroxylating dioxygenase subunit alpha [Myxococcota bacterium]|nr:aromatic ring-hydroxylating dioxygenase subunit alpha [Myxococcota bacterium]
MNQAIPAVRVADEFEAGFLPRSRFVSRDFLALENERLWPRVWQVVCREADLPQAGDWLEYEVADLSALVVRQSDGSLRAFRNSCPHRGNRIACGSGRAAAGLRCAFHGWSWKLDGSPSSVPNRSDLPALDDSSLALSDVAVGCAAGFVFINFSPDAVALSEFVAPLSAELGAYRFDEWVCFSSRRLVVPSNWKTCLDAFQEVYHVAAIHPQLLPGLKTRASRFDFLGPHSMMVNPNGELDPSAASVDDWGSEERSLYAAAARERASRGGHDLTEMIESRLVDSYQYHIFPNVSFNTHATGCQAFRFRPNGDDPDTCLLDVWLFEQPARGEDRPPEATPRDVDLQVESYGTSLRQQGLPESALSFGEELLETYALALDQDFERIPEVQRGLRTSGRQDLLLNRQECRILNWNRVLDEYLAGSDFSPMDRVRGENGDGDRDVE